MINPELATVEAKPNLVMKHSALTGVISRDFLLQVVILLGLVTVKAKRKNVMNQSVHLRVLFRDFHPKAATNRECVTVEAKLQHVFLHNVPTCVFKKVFGLGVVTS